MQTSLTTDFAAVTRESQMRYRTLDRLRAATRKILRASAVLFVILVPNTGYAAVITVGTHALAANEANQIITVPVAGAESVAGLDLFVQIGDGGGFIGGLHVRPAFQSVDILTGTIFATNNTGATGDPNGTPQGSNAAHPLIWVDSTTTASGVVTADGLLATIVVDTTGVSSGSFPLLLAGVDPRDGPFDTQFIDFNGNVVPTAIVNGAIEITPTPSSYWGVDNSGSWSVPGNWINGVPNGIGAAANFGSSISEDRSVAVDGSITVGTVSFDSPHSYSLAGAGSLTFGASATAHLNVLSGDHTIAAPLVIASNTIATVSAAASTLTIAEDIVGAGVLTKDGAGGLDAKNIRAAGLAIVDGVVVIATNGSTSGTSQVRNLTIGPTGQLDLSDNKLIVSEGGAAAMGSWDGSAYTGVTGLIQRGYANGTWSGSGIITSIVEAADHLATLAIAVAADTGYAGQSFGGLSVADDDVLIAYTYAGDADLSGSIDGDDYFRIDQGYATRNDASPLLGYANGDFDYSGIIDADDYFMIDRNYGRQGAAFSAVAVPGVISVPEPAGLAMLVVGSAAFSRTMRRRRSSRSVRLLASAAARRSTASVSVTRLTLLTKDRRISDAPDCSS